MRALAPWPVPGQTSFSPIASVRECISSASSSILANRPQIGQLEPRPAVILSSLSENRSTTKSGRGCSIGVFIVFPHTWDSRFLCRTALHCHTSNSASRRHLGGLEPHIDPKDFIAVAYPVVSMAPGSELRAPVLKPVLDFTLLVCAFTHQGDELVSILVCSSIGPDPEPDVGQSCAILCPVWLDDESRPASPDSLARS